MPRMQPAAEPKQGRVANAWEKLEDAIGSDDDVKPTSADGLVCLFIILGALVVLFSLS